MDYYQKYQKYKFKYLNLLSLTNHQSGGGDYTEEDFILLDKYLFSGYNKSILTEEELKILKKFINLDGDKENLLRDKSNNLLLEDPISGFIHIKNAVLINKEVYDANSLFNWIKYTEKNNLDINIPHNRERYSLTNLIDIRNKLDNDEDKNIIFNQILNKFSKNMQTQLMLLDKLKPEQLKIFFTKYDILKSEHDDYIILELVNYLLNNNITDENNNITENFKENLKKNYKLLLFVPENKMTFAICMIAVNTSLFALKYIPKDSIMTKEEYFQIYEEAVTQNGLALKFVPDNNKTFDICEIAVTQNGLALEFVPDNNKTFDICEIAVTQNGLALKFVPENKRTYEIYMLAVTKYGKHLENVILNDNITEEQYYELCEKAVENYGQAIFYVKTEVINENNENNEKYYKPKDMSPEQYYKLCKKALTKDGNALAYVNKNIKNITSDQYYKLYEIAVTTSESALEFIPKTLIDDTTTPFKYKPKNMTDEQYYELCIKAVTNNGLSISSIPYNIRQNMGNEKYSKIYELAIVNNKNAKPYEYIVQYMQNH